MKTKNGQKGFSVIFQIVFICAAILLTSIWTVQAQAGQSELLGEITDPNGAAIPNVRVLLTEKQTGRSLETVSDADGNFIFTNQKPGLYSVEFNAAGLTHLVRDNITLTTGERIRVDARLEAISLEEIVTVNSDAPLLRSETSSLGQVIDNKKIVDLPLNGRSFFSLVGLGGRSRTAAAHDRRRIAAAHQRRQTAHQRISVRRNFRASTRTGTSRI